MCTALHITLSVTDKWNVFIKLLKYTLSALNYSKRIKPLLVVLLEIRAAAKNDFNATCAEFVYGTTLRLLSDMLNSQTSPTSATEVYAFQLRALGNSLTAGSIYQYVNRSVYVHPSLNTGSHVSVRSNFVTPSP